MPEKKEEQKEPKREIMYFIAFAYYVLGMMDANGIPMMYQHNKVRLKNLQEYLNVKKQIEEGRERIVYHPRDGVSADQVVMVHVHQPLAEVSTFQEFAPVGIIVPADAGKIITGRVN